MASKVPRKNPIPIGPATEKRSSLGGTVKDQSGAGKTRIGEMAAIGGEVRSASIISKGRSTIKRFPADKLPEIMEKYPEVARHLFETLAARLGYPNDLVIKLAKRLHEEKIEWAVRRAGKDGKEERQGIVCRDA
jgi:hypothetical protein